MIVDATGTPLAATVTAANVADVKQLESLVDGNPPVPGKRARPRRRRKEVYADRAYDSEPHRKRLRRRGIRPRIARRKTAHGSGLGKVRWVVERTLSWLPRKRELRTRTDRCADIHEVFTSLGCALIYFKVLIASLYYGFELCVIAPSFSRLSEGNEVLRPAHSIGCAGPSSFAGESSSRLSSARRA